MVENQYSFDVHHEFVVDAVYHPLEQSGYLLSSVRLDILIPGFVPLSIIPDGHPAIISSQIPSHVHQSDVDRHSPEIAVVKLIRKYLEVDGVQISVIEMEGPGKVLYSLSLPSSIRMSCRVSMEASLALEITRHGDSVKRSWVSFSSLVR